MVGGGDFTLSLRTILESDERGTTAERTDMSGDL